jgi:hypothetical protein
MAHVVWKLSVARCVSSGAFSPLHIASVTFFPVHVACRQWFVAHSPVVVCGIAVRWILSACPFFVACGTFSVACGSVFLWPAQVSHVAWCALSVACPTFASRHAARAALRVVGCLLQTAHPLSHAVSSWLPVPSCMSSVACRTGACCRETPRRRARSASQRRSQLGTSVTGEARYRPRCACG